LNARWNALFSRAPVCWCAKREFVGLLELAENFRLADDHRVESAGDLEKVLQAVRLGEGIKFGAERALKGVMRDEKFF
jgi:hypothetical protein